MSKAFMLFNPISGRFQWRYLVERAAARLEKGGWDIEMCQPKDANEVTELARQAVEYGHEALFVVGGDGTIRRAVEGLMGSDTALGVLPGGTANVFAQEIGLPSQTWITPLALEKSASLLASARVQRMDVGMCNGEPFLLWVGAGLDAMVVHEIEIGRPNRRYLPEAHYAAATLQQVSLWEGVNLSVEADDAHVEGHFLIVLASNIRKYGGGFTKISPHACLDDGEMDIWLFSGDTMWQSIQHVFNVLVGQHVKSGDVQKLSFRKLRMRSEQPIYLQLDGEPMGSEGQVNIDLQHRVLSVLVPPTAPEALFTHPPETQRQVA
ncbi:MAG: diacylglycerol kinase family lipid kinase [Chloroflexi bacterium]|nr:MAG: diacylglycerol kinase family lipid kinase [Chloroflexota bacterium]MBL1196380.1 diacylglycerol kinase family lipid kinase [Chloroflexota bacterium]NOH13675.1 diacylglycerol kinase family lipid kinase [Chloroflexota bacterium]